MDLIFLIAVFVALVAVLLWYVSGLLVDDIDAPDDPWTLIDDEDRGLTELRRAQMDVAAQLRREKRQQP